MARKIPFATACMMALVAGGLQAAVVTSNTISFTDKATPLNFDFTGQAELPLIKSSSVLVGIESFWKFTPGSGQTGSIDLLANLYTPSFASGVDTKVGFSTTVDAAGGPTTASSAYTSQQGLTFSSQVIAALLASSNVVPAELVGAGAGFSNLDTFFANGGRAEGYIRLTTVDSKGSGDPVPEPASLLVWGGAALGAWAVRRKKSPVA